ncbi:MAG: four helix bundle protein [Deltaproteobacteria bacterium]|nr:four helix bundle protein [Deltaproteobacteria bacterium]
MGVGVDDFVEVGGKRGRGGGRFAMQFEAPLRNVERKCRYLVCMLNYKKLDVYRCSIEHLVLVAKVLDAQKGRRGNADVMDQLRRAALSISLNIAEGVGRNSPADQARHYVVARGRRWSVAPF